MKKYTSSQGFTIVELLAVVTILVIVASLIAAILSSTLRGSNKTKLNNLVSANGNYALSVISSIISSSQTILPQGSPPVSVCTDPASSLARLDFLRDDGGMTTLLCDGTTIASNGASLLDTSVVKTTTCYFKCMQSQNNPYLTPIIEVGFTLTDLGGTKFSETKSGPTLFKTSVSLRNYLPR